MPLTGTVVAQGAGDTNVGGAQFHVDVPRRGGSGAMKSDDAHPVAAPMALPLPPMGWMSWLRFLCNTDCAAHPKACINADLYRSTADALVAGGFADAGYVGVHIDDCWAAKQRDPSE